MTYTTDLNNPDPSTQMPSSGEGLPRLEPVDRNTVQQPESAGGDHTRLELDETLPAIQMPSSEDDQAGSQHVDAYPEVSMPGAFPVNISEDATQEMKNGGLTDQQISQIVEGLVKSSPFRTSAVNRALNMFSLPKIMPQPPVPPLLDPRAEKIIKDKLFTIPPPQQVKMPRAPQPHNHTTPPPAHGRHKPASDLHVRLDNLHTTIRDLNAVLQTFTQQPTSQPSSDTTSCRFLSLPPELRNSIYRYAITGPRTIEIDKTRWSTHQPPLLKTCKTIRNEALGLF